MATELQSEVDQLINQFDPSIHMGMVVVDLNTSETLYKRNPNELFVPASNMKLFSDAAALLALGPNYQFKSQLSTDATSIENGVLKGSLYLHFSGDPSFTQTHLNTLLAQLPFWGIRKISGDVILISSNSIADPYAPGRMATDNNYGYGAPVTPLVLDANRLTVTVNPSYREGDLATLELSSEQSGLPINNQVKTAESKTTCHVSFQTDPENHVTVNGCIGVGQSAVVEEISIRSPLLYIQNRIKTRLAYLNIKLNGQVQLGHAPTSSLLMTSHASKPITQLMADTLKPSDNLYADSLYLHTASHLNGAPLNWPQAQTVIKTFLEQQTGVNLDSAVLIDGSGLSREDKLTALQTVGLLRFLYERFPLTYEYIAALPIAGQDGTLLKRFRKPTQQGLLRAKTGTMTGIMSLSGYLYTANSHTLAFAIFINKTPGSKPHTSYRSLIDNLCDFFLQQKPDNRQVAHTETQNPRIAFQQQPTQADNLHRKYANWRQLESAVKQALKGQAVTVLFRGNQLVLKDNGTDLNKTWSILQTLSKKYVFTVALQSRTPPSGDPSNPHLLWVKSITTNPQTARIWTLRESVS